MRKARPSNTKTAITTRPRLHGTTHLAHVTTLVACGLALRWPPLVLRQPARTDPTDALRAIGSPRQEPSWRRRRAFRPPRLACAWPARSDLDGLVFPVALGESHGETVAAVYVPATREILLADDLNPGTLLTRSYLVHELVHAQQFTSRAHEHVRCPGALEADAYGTQALYLSTWGLREEAFLLQILGMFQSACGYSY